ncbi:glutaredoxin family protein [Thalassoglobus polymorphus]|nr:glutaredoxin family protein [Thalassoglobus polymorphus]
MSNLRAPVFIGTAFILLGATGMYLLLESQNGTFTGRLSHPLTAHAPIWGMTFAGMLGLGIWLLWNRSHAQTTWRPTYSGRRFRTIVLYTRSGCPLCDEAAELLGAYRRWLPPTTEVDIDLDHDLQERLGEEIPVIQVDGKTRFKGRISEVLLQRLIEGTPPLA